MRPELKDKLAAEANVAIDGLEMAAAEDAVDAFRDSVAQHAEMCALTWEARTTMFGRISHIHEYTDRSVKEQIQDNLETMIGHVAIKCFKKGAANG